jgi:hypothetical protein
MQRMTDEKKKKGWLRGIVDKVEAQAESQKEQQSANAAMAGNLVLEKQFGLNRVAIYEKGFVRVGRGGLNMLTALSPYETLKSIEYTEHIQDRSAAGAAWNGPLASKQRRGVALTIVTDRKVHSLSTEAQMLGGEDKAGRALEAAGKAVLADLANSRVAPATQAAPPDVADQIRKLADLHSAGILTDEEFAKKKADLLDRM